MKSFTPLILIIVSIGLFFIHINPRYATVRELQDKEAEYQEALQSSETVATTRDALLDKYNSFSNENIDRLEKIIPDKVNTVKLVADLDSIGERNGLVLSGIKISEENLDDSSQVVDTAVARPYLITSISFTFSASYEELRAFIEDLEKSLQLVDVTSINFVGESVDSSQPTNRFKYTVTINTYWLKP